MVNVAKLILKGPLRTPVENLSISSTRVEAHVPTDPGKFLCERASRPVGDDPLQLFTSEMSEEEMDAQFAKLIEKARQSVAA
jgi:hypothetical protein